MARIRRRSRCELKSEINIVPLLDVLLVLLLIFMATAPVVMESVEVDLPQAVNAKTVSGDSELPVIIEVSGIGKYSIVASRRRQEQLAQSQIVSQAREYLKTNPKTAFLIAGSKEVPYDEIIKALNMLHKAGVTSVGLMTQPL